MSEAVQITLIICVTIILVQILGFLIVKGLWNKQKNNRDIENYCKSPTYTRPLRPGSKIGHNPSPEGERPGFPGSKL